MQKHDIKKNIMGYANDHPTTIHDLLVLVDSLMDNHQQANYKNVQRREKLYELLGVPDAFRIVTGLDPYQCAEGVRLLPTPFGTTHGVTMLVKQSDFGGFRKQYSDWIEKDAQGIVMKHSSSRYPGLDYYAIYTDLFPHYSPVDEKPEREFDFGYIRYRKDNELIRHTMGIFSIADPVWNTLHSCDQLLHAKNLFFSVLNVFGDHDGTIHQKIMVEVSSDHVFASMYGSPVCDYGIGSIHDVFDATGDRMLEIDAAIKHSMLNAYIFDQNPLIKEVLRDMVIEYCNIVMSCVLCPDVQKYLLKMMGYFLRRGVCSDDPFFATCTKQYPHLCEPIPVRRERHLTADHWGQCERTYRYMTHYGTDPCLMQTINRGVKLFVPYFDQTLINRGYTDYIRDRVGICL